MKLNGKYKNTQKHKTPQKSERNGTESSDSKLWLCIWALSHYNVSQSSMSRGRPTVLSCAPPCCVGIAIAKKPT